jgi:uncharacterized glyoxalase superfamily protein PhnB
MAPGQKEDAPVGGFTRISFVTDDVQATYEELSAKGVNFIQKPTQMFWGGIEAQFADPDGNIFLLDQGED